MLNLKLITPPAVEPVTLALAKSHCRIDADDEDALLPIYITAARQAAEKYTKRAFFNQTWQLSLDHFPIFDCSATLPTRNRQDWPFYSSYWDGITIRLPRPTCVSVTSITYVDLTGTTQTLPTESYYVDTTSEPARIVPKPGEYWPYTQAYLPGSVQVTFVAGSYGDGVEMNNCPNTVVMAILLLIGAFYENREDASLGQGLNVATLPWGVKALLDTERFDCFSYSGN
jgi:uncharacterized phiE125 gp8 family phage protein